MSTDFHFSAIFLLIFIHVNAFAQDNVNAQMLEYKTGIPTEWPARLNVVEAAPKNHRILIENDRVRVLEVTLLPGEIEMLYHYRWPSVLYIQEAGDFIDFDGDGKVIFDTRTLPEPLQYPLSMWKELEARHAVENLSLTLTMRLIRLEIKE